MPPLVLTPEILRSAEQFSDEFHLARMQAGRSMPQLGIEVRAFGTMTAIRVEAPFLSSKNRILGPIDLGRLPEVLDFFREKGLPCGLTLPYDEGSPALFDAFVAAGLRSGGSGATPAARPIPFQGVNGILIRESPLDEKDTYLDLYARAFATRGSVSTDELAFQWIEDTLPITRRFVAEIDGRPVAMASMGVGVEAAYLATCGVLPEFRGRGIQAAMIQARLGVAHDHGCRIALGGGRLFSPPRRNFERAGFAPLPLGMSWSRASNR